MIAAMLGVYVVGLVVALTARAAAPPARVAALAAQTSRIPAPHVVRDRLAPLGLGRVAPARPAPPPATSAPTAPSPRATPPAAPTPTPTPTSSPSKPAAAPRWLPSGAGLWVYRWDRTDNGNAASVVSHARAAGVSTLYVRTGTAAGGFVGGPILDELLPATRGTNVSIVAWDFPNLRDPVADAKRLAAAALYTVPGAPRVRAVAPDIETPAEGTYLHGKPLDIYLTTLRTLLPHDVAILGTVPWPSEHRSGYPYWLVARYSDALMPMAYWYNRSPAAVTTESIDRLAPYHRPVIPAGQGFDPRIDAPYLAPWNPGPELAEFLDAARSRNVRAVSLWAWQSLGPSGWHALVLADRFFGNH